MTTIEDLSGRTRRYRVTAKTVVRWNRFTRARSDRQAPALSTCCPFAAVAHGPLS